MRNTSATNAEYKDIATSSPMFSRERNRNGLTKRLQKYYFLVIFRFCEISKHNNFANFGLFPTDKANLRRGIYRIDEWIACARREIASGADGKSGTDAKRRNDIAWGANPRVWDEPDTRPEGAL